jgi:hypothetical protein
MAMGGREERAYKQVLARMQTGEKLKLMLLASRGPADFVLFACGLAFWAASAGDRAVMLPIFLLAGAICLSMGSFVLVMTDRTLYIIRPSRIGNQAEPVALDRTDLKVHWGLLSVRLNDTAYWIRVPQLGSRRRQFREALSQPAHTQIDANATP